MRRRRQIHPGQVYNRPNDFLIAANNARCFRSALALNFAARPAGFGRGNAGPVLRGALSPIS